MITLSVLVHNLVLLDTKVFLVTWEIIFWMLFSDIVFFVNVLISFLHFVNACCPTLILTPHIHTGSQTYKYFNLKFVSSFGWVEKLNFQPTLRLINFFFETMTKMYLECISYNYFIVFYFSTVLNSQPDILQPCVNWPFCFKS